MRYIKFVSVLVLVVVILSVILVKVLWNSTALVTVKNLNQESIESGSIALCGQVQRLAQLEPSRDQTLKFSVKRDCHFSVETTFSSGVKVAGEVGYVTPASDFNGTILIHADRVELGRTEFK